ncbi:MAG: hypothetical protein ABJB47_20475 [Actinomycetota bacterium]
MVARSTQLDPAGLDALLPAEPFPDEADFIESARELMAVTPMSRLLDEHPPPLGPPRCRTTSSPPRGSRAPRGGGLTWLLPPR